MSFGDMRVHFSRSQSPLRWDQCCSELRQLNPEVALIAHKDDSAPVSDCAVVLHVVNRRCRRWVGYRPGEEEAEAEAGCRLQMRMPRRKCCARGRTSSLGSITGIAAIRWH